MTSINTNRAAMTALESLNATAAKLESTQQRISTGMRVATATDNAAYWSIATTMRSDNSSLSTVKDALGLGAATVDVTYTALNNEIQTVQHIKDKLVAAAQPGVDRSKIQSEISQLQSQLKSVAELHSQGQGSGFGVPVPIHPLSSLTRSNANLQFKNSEE